MATSLELVIRGYKSLSADDKEKLEEFVKGYVHRSIAMDEALTKSLHVSMGPVASGCPCCGR
jgi:hypothetical protein